jgi:glucose-6-phosphate 1-dehydrogenase
MRHIKKDTSGEPYAPPAGVARMSSPVLTISLRAKRSGELMAVRPLELSVVDEGKQNDQEPRIGDYERLLGDAMTGDATLFARQDVVEAGWAIVDPIIDDATPMYEYEPGTWAPPQADRLVADGSVMGITL